MSRTMNIGVHKKSHYSYMASVMQESLLIVLQRKRVKEKTSVPPGALYAAEQFFSSVCEAFQKKVPKNPLASINDYRIAFECVSKALEIGSRHLIDAKLVAYKALLASLREPRVLDSKELVLIDELRFFFKRLSE